MMHDEEAAGTRCPKVRHSNIKSIKFLVSGVKTRVCRVSRNNIFQALSYQKYREMHWVKV